MAIEKISEHTGDELFSMGCIAHNAGDTEKAVKLWEESAKLGNADAYLALSAAMKESGDIEKAMELLIEAADRGSVKALEILEKIAGSDNN